MPFMWNGVILAFWAVLVTLFRAATPALWEGWVEEAVLRKAAVSVNLNSELHDDNELEGRRLDEKFVTTVSFWSFALKEGELENQQWCLCSTGQSSSFKLRSTLPKWYFGTTLPGLNSFDLGKYGAR